MVPVTDESPLYETREVSHDDSVQIGGELRHGDFSLITDALQALGPTGIAAAAGYAAKQAKDVVVAKIQANAQVKVARIENDRPEHGGGRHRDE